MLELRIICAILHLFAIIDSVYSGFGSGGLNGGAIEAQCLEMDGYQHREVPIMLARETISTWNNVELVRHHIIPACILRDFFNAAVRRNDEHNVELSGIINLIGFLANDSLHLYPGSDTLYQTIRSDLSRLRSLQTLYVSDTILNNPPLDIMFDARYLVHSLFQWIPANLFIGPRARRDDPGDEFEVNAIYIIGRRDFERLDTIRRLMISYIDTGRRNEFSEVIELLCDISRDRNTPYPYNADQWELYRALFGETQYYIDTDSNIRQKRNTPVIQKVYDDPYCLVPLEKLKILIKNNNLMIIAQALERVKNSKNSYKFYEEDKSSWKEYYDSINWNIIWAKGRSMCGLGLWYNPWGFKFNDGSFAVGIAAADAKNGKDNWVTLSHDFSTGGLYAGQVYFDKNGRPVVIVITSDVAAMWGAGWSFIYKGGKWEYEPQDSWLWRFDGRTESLDDNAPRFLK